MTTRKTNISDILGRSTVHPFPARMAPGIALETLSSLKGPLRVLDPMMGSGTVPALARSRGHKAFGFDIDPLAVLIARAWTVTCDHHEARLMAKCILKSVEKRVRLHSSEAYPSSADLETREFIDYWFDRASRRQLTALANAIEGVENNGVRDVLWCAFSRMIITKQYGVSLAMDLSHSRPHRAFDIAPAKPLDRFLPAVEKVLEGVLGANRSERGPSPNLKIGDARSMPLVKDSIDVVITSPPYLNAIDYIRCSKFSLVWMGFTVGELREVRSESVGSEVSGGAPLDDPEIIAVIKSLGVDTKLVSRDRGILAKYIGDMRKSVREVARVLRPGGVAVYVVGENTIRNTYIQTSLVVRSLANAAGLSCARQRRRTLPANRRYLPPPTVKRGKMNTRMSQEVVLTFSK